MTNLDDYTIILPAKIHADWHTALGKLIGHNRGKGLPPILGDRLRTAGATREDVLKALREMYREDAWVLEGLRKVGVGI